MACVAAHKEEREKKKNQAGESRVFVTEGRALSDGRRRGEIRREAERTRASHSEALRSEVGLLRDTRHVAADGGGGSSVWLQIRSSARTHSGPAQSKAWRALNLPTSDGRAISQS